VLDESEDVLMNINMVESEKAAKNVELKKGKPTYNPYDDEEVDELGNVSVWVWL
jgi:U4/U6.U5 tri-snRNP-associated protein 1